MAAPRPLVAGNWKMNGLKASLAELEAIRDAVKAGGAGRAEAALCPPFTLVAAAAAATQGSPLAIGAQDCHAKVSGAHTGDISAQMLRTRARPMSSSAIPNAAPTTARPTRSCVRRPPPPSRRV